MTYLTSRVIVGFFILIELIMLTAGNFLVTYYLKQTIYAIAKNGVIRLTWTRLCHLSFFLFVVVHLFPLTLRLGRQSTLAA
jgi:hypothetical protein